MIQRKRSWAFALPVRSLRAGRQSIFGWTAETRSSARGEFCFDLVHQRMRQPCLAQFGEALEDDRLP